MKNSVIFDLDGTLWEVIDSTYISANKIASKYNQDEITKEVICSVFGLNKEDAAKKYFPKLTLDKSIPLMDEISKINIDYLTKNGGNLYPNLINILYELSKKYDLYIVSNTAEISYIEAFLISSNTKSYFKDYIAASKLNITKSEAIKKIIKDNKINNSVYVGDTIIDYNSSLEASIPFIQARYGFGDNLKTDYYINNIDELPSILCKIFV